MPTRKIKNTIAVLIFSVLFLGNNALGAQSCQEYDATSVLPNKFGSAFNFFTSPISELFHVSCDTHSHRAVVQVSDSFVYTYQEGYVWRDNSWKQVDIECNRKVGKWCAGSTKINIENLNPETKYFVALYTCQKVDGQWKCGCRDKTCSQSYWQIQAFRLPSDHSKQTSTKPATVKWKKANMTWYSSYPEPGSEEYTDYNGGKWEGLFAGIDGKRSLQWVKSHNIASVHSKFFNQFNGKWLVIRNPRTKKELNVQVLDMCSDDDCDGCCTENMKGTGFLIDLEEYTARRFLGGNPDSAIIEWRLK